MSQGGYRGTGSSPPTPPTPFDPLKYYQLIDDWPDSSGNWNYSGLNTPIYSEPDHPGIIQNNYADSPPPPIFNGYYRGDLVNPYAYIIVGGGVLTVTYIVNLNNLSVAPDNYVSYFGLTDTMVLTEPPAIQNGIWFSYTDSVNLGRWVINTAKGGVTTATNTSTAATTGWLNITLVVAADGSLVTFKVNGATIGTISTNIPIVNMVPFMNWSLYGVDPGAKIDMFYLLYALTNTR